MATVSSEGDVDPVAAARSGELKSTAYEIFIGALSVLSIVNLVLIEIARGRGTAVRPLRDERPCSSLILFVDFCYRISTTSSKAGYFFKRFGWADLLASLPFPQVKVLRLFRLIRVVRLLRALGIRAVVDSLVKDRAGSALYVLLLIAIFVLEFGSLGMLRLEDDVAGANIVTASDALWYVIATMSTVGYGDTFPVSNAGRVMGSMIIVIGVAIFGTLSGYLANLFLSPRRASASELSTHDELRQQVDQLKALLEQQNQTVAALDELTGR